jgi:hypothetical protein
VPTSSCRYIPLEIEISKTTETYEPTLTMSVEDIEGVNHHLAGISQFYERVSLPLAVSSILMRGKNSLDAKSFGGHIDNSSRPSTAV